MRRHPRVPRPKQAVFSQPWMNECHTMVHVNRSLLLFNTSTQNTIWSHSICQERASADADRQVSARPADGICTWPLIYSCSWRSWAGTVKKMCKLRPVSWSLRWELPRFFYCLTPFFPCPVYFTDIFIFNMWTTLKMWNLLLLCRRMSTFLDKCSLCPFQVN